MTVIPDVLAVYGAPFAAVLVLYLWRRRRSEKKGLAIQKEQQQAGLGEPPSLHPLIDEAVCIGCKACVQACPEQNVLAVIENKARLVSPANCIGHGACKTACPVDAITLVFGTQKRGVDLPVVGPDFETNVPGIFIAGELGGMGLIRNAVEQGRQAVESVRKRLKDLPKKNGVADLLIIGAGPAGFSAALSAHEKGLDYIVLEQDSLGGTVAHYPRGKVVMSRPVVLPLAGPMPGKEMTKEKLIAFWTQAEAKTGVRIRYHERVEKISPDADGFEVRTGQGVFRARAVLLAIGRRGTPRKLDVPGEELSKVVYRLTDPDQYLGRQVLVVGGGDAAIEAALATASVAKAVTLSYRGDAFARVKTANRDGIERAQSENKLQVIFQSVVREIRDREVVLDRKGETLTMPNDAVIVCAGGVLPTEFLKSAGVAIETKYGQA
jgi:putative YpdA family bacillithiol system oxidoreductase